MKHASYVVVPALCLAVVLSAYAPVSADGIKSQWKGRLPQGVVTDTGLSGTIVRNDTAASDKQKAILGMLVRRNVRANERRYKGYAATAAEKASSSLPVVNSAPSKVLTDTERARMILKNEKVAIAKCAALHTHERATCLYQAQLKRGTNQ